MDWLCKQMSEKVTGDVLLKVQVREGDLQM